MLARLSQAAFFALALIAGSNVNATPLVYGTYYDDSASGTCNGNNCRANFSQLPADKLLMVTNVGCSFVSTPGPISAAYLQVSATLNGIALARYFPLTFPVPQLVSNAYFTTIGQNTHFLFGQGRFPFILITTSGQPVTGSLMACTIVGDLITPIQ